MAILFVPMMRLFSDALYSATVSGDMLTAVNLGRFQMERIRNLNFTKRQLKELGEMWYPPLDTPPLERNQAKWRVRTLFKPDTDPLEVDVQVFTTEDPKKPMVSLVTLVEDNLWTLDE